MKPLCLLSLMAPTQSLPGVGVQAVNALERLGSRTILDLLKQLPFSLRKRKLISSLTQATPGEVITFPARILHSSYNLKPSSRKNRSPQRVTVDVKGYPLDLVFFNSIPHYIKKNLVVGEQRVISGKLEYYQGKPQITHPDHIGPLNTLNEWEGVEPLYSLTQGIKQRQLRRIILSALERINPLPDWIASDILQSYQWAPWHIALKNVHNPTYEEEILPSHPYRKRLAFDELFANQLALSIIRNAQTLQGGQQVIPTYTLEQKILDSLQFKLTDDQILALKEIEQDLKDSKRMVRLLQGDVGSGKTIVAFLAMVKAVESGFQTALLAPTEILARQHLDTMIPWAEAAGIKLDLLLGKDSVKVKKEKYAHLNSGSTQIIIGTHALIQEAVSFHNLGLIVVDEQHRFGVEQRLKLAEKGHKVNVLSMTATPIPRSLMLATYGDLPCSYLRQKPKGRQEIQTKAIPVNRLNEVIEALERIIKKGEKAYWICPLVEESQALDLAAVQERFEFLAKRFPEKVGIMHGRLKGSEKEEIINEFREGSLKLLVATTVVEVGVHIEDATVMIIEHAERFGLTQLHQLRGRVGRGDRASTCILLYHSPLNPLAKARIQAMRTTNDGFKIAEEDLRLRGGGDTLGLKQSGIPHFHFVDFSAHQDLISLAHQQAKRILQEDFKLETSRGQAARLLLSLFGRESATRLLQAG
jgi:ATP-dependent DNA helicase RecG